MDGRAADSRAATAERRPRGHSRALALALAGVLLLAAAEPATIAAVSVEGESCRAINDSFPELADRCELSGFERHGGALLVLAALAGAGALLLRARSSVAGGGVLIAVGAVALAIALIGDLPETDETGAIGLNFEGATASAGLGFYLELTGAVLSILAGVLALGSPNPPRDPSTHASAPREHQPQSQ